MTPAGRIMQENAQALRVLTSAQSQGPAVVLLDFGINMVHKPTVLYCTALLFTRCGLLVSKVMTVSVKPGENCSLIWPRTYYLEE